jgi:aspartyl protease family protein
MLVNKKQSSTAPSFKISIGNIFLYNVAAHINPAMKSDAILLGMSALKEVEFSQKGKQLTLREYP